MSILKNTQWIRKQKAQAGTFGLEIETETLIPYMLEPNGRGEYNFYDAFKLKDWKIVEDHSLRNFGYEYILTKPLAFEKVFKALEEFDKQTKAQKIDFLQDRHSTSVHVHLNFQDETFKTLGNYITVFTLFEEALVRFCGEDRRSNFFCLTSKYAEGLTRRFINFFEKVEEGDMDCIIGLDPEVSKYSSLNIVPLYKLGSIEVRTMRGVTDVATIYKWVGMLNSLLEFARRDLTPIDIINRWRIDGEDFFCQVMGDYAKDLAHDDLEKEIERNLWPASSIACCVEDWNALDMKMSEAQVEYNKKMKEAKKDPYGDGLVGIIKVAPGIVNNWDAMNAEAEILAELNDDED